MEGKELLDIEVDADDAMTFGVPAGFRLFATLEQSVHWARLRDCVKRCPIVTTVTSRELGALSGEIHFTLPGDRAAIITTDGESFRCYVEPPGVDDDLISFVRWVKLALTK